MAEASLSVRLHRIDRTLEKFGRRKVVTFCYPDIFPPGEFHSALPLDKRTSGVLLIDYQMSNVLIAPVLFQHLRTVVRGRVIEQNQLVIRKSLGEDTVNA